VFRGGTDLVQLDVSVMLEAAAFSKERTADHCVTLPMAGLAAGDYLLEVETTWGHEPPGGPPDSSSTEPPTYLPLIPETVISSRSRLSRFQGTAVRRAGAGAAVPAPAR
jgi:hypothetical protein